MVGFGVGVRRMSSVGMETSCEALLRELQHIWTEIGESESDKDRILMDIERECLEVYRKKVDEANEAKAQLLQTVAAKEAELTALMATLGEHTMYSPMEKRLTPLKELLSLVTPILEDMRLEKEERIKQFINIQAQIDKVHAEITGLPHKNSGVTPFSVDEHDLSMRRLNEYQAHLRTLHKDKSDRLQKVIKCVNEVHSLCGVLGLDFAKTVNEVHPSLMRLDPNMTQTSVITHWMACHQ